MTVATRATLKGYFDNGDTITASAMVDLIDSFVHLSDTTAQSLNSDLTVPNLVATNISANNVGVAGKITASAATFTGAVRQGASAAASASQSLGYFLVVQEATIAGAATAQVAYLPTTSNIHSVAVKVLTPGSTGAGGMTIKIGHPTNGAWFGDILCSGAGYFEVASVAFMDRYTGISSAFEMYALGASAGTNMIGVVKYYQRA